MLEIRNSFQTWTRLAATASLVVLGTACGLETGGGSPGANVVAPLPPAALGTSAVTLAWEAAEGPVAGYAVYVTYDGGSFDRQMDVPTSMATLEGTPGQSARIVVAAFDTDGEMGPASPASPPFTFPGAEPESAAAMQQTARASTTQLAPPSAVADSDGAADVDAADVEDDSETTVDLQALTGGLVWTADGALRVTDAALQTHLVMAAPTGADLLAAADFDGDGAPDVLWSAYGVLSYTPLADGANASAVEFGELAEGERLVAVGDFDGDGQDDLLLRDAGGSVHNWLTASDAPGEALGQPGSAVMQGVGDFDGDGLDDLAWREADGTLSLWLIDGTQAHSIVEVQFEAGLEITGVGDFDGDGSAELALRDAAGSLFVHDPIASRTDAAGSASGVWNTVGATDLNGDGSDELVLASESSLMLAAMPGGTSVALDPTSPWELVALLP